MLAGLTKHRGPILTLANWSGEWPGLVGMLNLNASLTKAGVPYSSIWSEDFTDAFARSGAAAVARRPGAIDHDTSHAQALDDRDLRPAVRGGPRRRGSALGETLRRDQAIIGVFDEGCMGMYNAIIPDELLHPHRALQGAAVAVGALRRDARGPGRARRAATTSG